MSQTTEREPKRRRISRDDLRKLAGIYRFVWPYKWALFLGLFLLALSTLLTMAFPKGAGELVDIATGESDWYFDNINTLALALIGVLVVMAVISFFRTILVAIVSEKSLADIRTALYNKLITLPVIFYEERRVGELTSRITNDVTQLQEMLSWSLVEFLRQVAIFIVGTAIILVIAPKLTLVMLSTLPVTVIMAFFIGRYIKKLSKKTQDSLAEANTVVEETFQAVQVVKTYTNELLESLRYRKSINESVKHALTAARYRAALVSFVILGIFGGIVLVLWVGGKMVQNDPNFTVGDLTSFVIYTFFIGAAVGTIGDLYARLQKTIGASERLLDILDEDPEVAIEETVNKLNLKGHIEYQNVAFTYPTRPDVQVLNDISIKVSQGSKAALVGHSGSGKSTIIKLLLRFYDVDSGSLLIDGMPIQDYPIKELRQHIGIVPQEVILFGGSIRENIAYGKPNASDEEIETAARKANALEFINHFPEGLDTLVGDRGVKLSGGQKQRIAIARAILKDPKILILDEATSSLDSESESLVQAALDELMENRTTIMIAHRLSTIMKADQIFVLDQGEIAESGTHQQLAAREKGVYAKLLKLQFEGALE